MLWTSGSRIIEYEEGIIGVQQKGCGWRCTEKEFVHKNYLSKLMQGDVSYFDAVYNSVILSNELAMQEIERSYRHEIACAKLRKRRYDLARMHGQLEFPFLRELL